MTKEKKIVKTEVVYQHHGMTGGFAVIKIPVPEFNIGTKVKVTIEELEDQKLRCPKCNTKNKLDLVHIPFTNGRYNCRACGTRELRREDVEQ